MSQSPITIQTLIKSVQSQNLNGRKSSIDLNMNVFLGKSNSNTFSSQVNNGNSIKVKRLIERQGLKVGFDKRKVSIMSSSHNINRNVSLLNIENNEVSKSKVESKAFPVEDQEKNDFSYDNIIYKSKSSFKTNQKHQISEGECLLQLENFKIISTISKSFYSQIKLVLDKNTSQLLSVKILNYSLLKTNQQEDKIWNEFHILKQVNHPFIIKMFSFNITSSHIFFGLEYIPGGDLMKYLLRKRRLSFEETRFFISQVLLSILYLHSNGIIYRDIKPENILLTSNGYTKLTDFSISKPCKGKTFTFCGTPEYIPPEVICNLGHTYSYDFWSLGVLTYELLVGVTPFAINTDDPFLIYDNIMKGRLKFPVDLKEENKSFIKMLLVADPSKRLGYGSNGSVAVCNNSFFKGFDWVSLERQEMKANYIPNCKFENSNFQNCCDDSYEDLLDYAFNAFNENEE